MNFFFGERPRRPSAARLVLHHCLLAALLISAPPLAAEKMAPGEDSDAQIESLTMDVLRLQRDWLELQEWPSESPERLLEVYLTTSLANDASVYSVSLTLDNGPPVKHDYDAGQIEALRQGGAHRVLMQALDPGSYLLKARVVGWDGLQRSYQANTRLALRKQQTSKLVELHLVSLEPGERPQIVVRQWD